MRTSNFLNGFYVTIFFGTLCTISYNIFGWDLSLERIFSVTLFLSIIFLLFSRDLSARYAATEIPIVVLVLIIEIWLLFCTMFSSDDVRFLYYRTMFNIFLGFACHMIFRAVSFERKYKKIGVVLFLLLFLLSVYGAFDFKLLAFPNKHKLAAIGFNPNSILNSLILYLIIFNLIYAERKTSMAMSAMMIVVSALQFSRQNFIASIFLLLAPIRNNKTLLILLLCVSAIAVAWLDLRIFTYLSKGFFHYIGYTDSTRLEWIFASLDLMANSIFIPNFDQPVDNTALTILLQFGVVAGISLLAVSLVALVRLAIISAPLAMSFLVLLVLNDIHFEAAFWFIVFCMLSDRTFKRVMEYQNLKQNSFPKQIIGGRGNVVVRRSPR